MSAREAPIHRWYRLVLSFPPELVREYLDRFDVGGDGFVLDPFCGVGTTLVECKRRGLKSVGVESNPVAAFASAVKTRWDIAPRALKQHSAELVARAEPAPRDELGPEAAALLIKNSISPRPLHKLLHLGSLIEQRNAPCRHHQRLALAKTSVLSSNLRFSPEVGVGRIKGDDDVYGRWLECIDQMADDLAAVAGNNTPALVCRADARQMQAILPPDSVAAVITSPPYPNEKDYTRATRLESVLLGFMRGKRDLRQIKQWMLASHTRACFADNADLALGMSIPIVQALAQEIESRRLALGKTSGFERRYAEVVCRYFGGLCRHLDGLKPVLKPGARLAYVVGEQASFFRVHIPTGVILSEIASMLGYRVEAVRLLRTRFATRTGSYLREEVVVMRYEPSLRRFRRPRYASKRAC